MTSLIFNAEFSSLLMVITVLYTRHQRLLTTRQNEGSLIWIHRNEIKWTTIVEYCLRLRVWVQNTTQSERDQIKGCQISSLQSLFMWVGRHSKCTSAQHDASASNTGPSSLIYRQRERVSVLKIKRVWERELQACRCVGEHSIKFIHHHQLAR